VNSGAHGGAGKEDADGEIAAGGQIELDGIAQDERIWAESKWSCGPLNVKVRSEPATIDAP